MCRFSWNLGASTSWNPQGLSRTVQGLLLWDKLKHLHIMFVLTELTTWKRVLVEQTVPRLIKKSPSYYGTWSSSSVFHFSLPLIKFIHSTPSHSAFLRPTLILSSLLCLYSVLINLSTPNDDYSARTAPLTSKCCILYIYSTNVGTEYFKHGIYSPFFPLKNAVCFTNLTYLVPVLFIFYIQDVLKLKKNNSGTKRLMKGFMNFNLKNNI